MEFLRKEGLEQSQFDPNGLKQGVWEALERGAMSLVCKESSVLRVVAILPAGAAVPCDDWGRLAQWAGKGPRNTVYWFGADAPRRFPKRGALGAEHVNGGYTHPCSTRGIVIYRLEEATRVFLHEMLHALCLDPPVQSIPYRESVIETWAELFLIAYRSKGSATEAERLLRLQTQWVADTARRAALHGVSGPADYAWRYLNGREPVFLALGIPLPKPRGNPAQTRFTHPSLD